jgi:hypothetical protein
MNSLNRVLRYTLTGFAALAVGALVLLIFGAEDTDDWFSWTIQPPLSAASLGAFYGAALVLFIAGLRASPTVTVRQIAPAVLLIAFALLIVTLVHLDKFDMDSLFGVFWLCAYLAAPPLLLWGVLAERGALRGPVAGSPLGRPLRLLLGAEGAVMIGVSGLLLLAPETAADIWPWQLTPLVARAFGSFTLGIGLVAVTLARDGILGSRGIALSYAVLGALQLLVVLNHEGDLGSDDAATAVYVGFLVAVLITGLYGLFSSSARALSR